MAAADLGVGNTDYVAQCAEGCEKDVRHTCAVYEPTPGELLAEVTGEAGQRQRRRTGACASV
jgi:hypothetical protein